MCNLNFMARKGGIQKGDLAFLDSVTHHSYASNKDGEGYLNATGIMARSTTKMLCKNHAKNIVGEKWVVFHERYGTHGTKDLANVQPLRQGRLTLLHNGILQRTSTDGKSDTRLYLEDLQTQLGETLNPVTTWQQSLEKEDGYKSMFLYDDKTQTLHYYKDARADFYRIKNCGLVFASTSRANVEYAKKFYALPGAIEEVPNDTIYRVEASGAFVKVLSVEPPKIVPVKVVSVWDGKPDKKGKARRKKYFGAWGREESTFPSEYASSPEYCVYCEQSDKTCIYCGRGRSQTGTTSKPTAWNAEDDD